MGWDATQQKRDSKQRKISSQEKYPPHIFIEKEEILMVVVEMYSPD